MRVIIPINEVTYNEDGMGSQTCKVIDFGDVSVRTAKRKFRIVLAEWGVPTEHIKRVIKEYL